MNTLSPPRAAPPAIRIAIQTRGGLTYRYGASDLRLELREGEVRVIERDGGCFVFFNHCNLAVTDPEGRTLFQLNRGELDESASDLSIVTAAMA
jgi:hypothetical protein